MRILGLLDWPKKKKSKSSNQKAEEVSDSGIRYPKLQGIDGEIIDNMKKLFEMTKDRKVNMEYVQEMAKKQPTHRVWQGCKNPEEFKWRRWSLHASMVGDYEKAIEFADKGLEVNPKSPYLFYMRGRSKGDIGKFEEGIEDLNEAIKLNPEFADAFVERGYIKQKMGDIKGAKKDYEKARKTEPSIVLPR